MSKLLIPRKFNKIKDKLFIAQIFVLNEKGAVVQAFTFPQPTNGIFNGAFLSQIHANLAQPVDIMLQTALQSDEVKFLFRITELEKFKAEQAKAQTLQSLRVQATTATQSEPTNDAGNTIN